MAWNGQQLLVRPNTISAATATALSVDPILSSAQTDLIAVSLCVCSSSFSCRYFAALRANQIAALLEELSMDEELRTELGIVAEVDGDGVGIDSTVVAEGASGVGER